MTRNKVYSISVALRDLHQNLEDSKGQQFPTSAGGTGCDSPGVVLPLPPTLFSRSIFHKLCEILQLLLQVASSYSVSS